jgi:hypothetical protein
MKTNERRMTIIGIVSAILVRTKALSDPPRFAISSPSPETPEAPVVPAPPESQSED